MPHMRLKHRVLWTMSALFGGLGTFVLYLSLSTQSLRLGVYAVILIWAAAAIVWFLPD